MSDPVLCTLPVFSVGRVCHIGTLDPSDKGKLTWRDSYEGHGLSVSVHPDEWERIAKLGGLGWWELTCPDGAFLDALELTDTQRQRILDWGLQRGLCELRDVWSVARYDSELDDVMLMSFDSEEQAREEAELDELKPDAVRCDQRPQATARMRERVGCDSGPDCTDHLLALWVEDTQPQLDGVWWHFNLGPMSAPAGTILPGKLGRWQRKRISRGSFDQAGW